MTPPDLTITTDSAEATRLLGRRIGSLAPGGVLLALHGDLGSGKTTFVQGLARGLDVPDRYPITSPSFTLVNEYPGRHALYHVDLYRIGDVDELETIGFFDIVREDGVVAVEWAERAAAVLPADRFDLTFSLVDDRQRRIRIDASGQTSTDLLKRLQRRLTGD